ncbi:MAG: hypothetical protein K6357_04460 [Elusimicrobiota bacterium]
MRKVKNFKIPIYYYDIERKSKKEGIDAIELFGGKENYEKNFKEYVSNFVSYLSPSAVYDTIEMIEMEKLFGKDIISSLDTKGCNIYSFVIITMGSDIEQKMALLEDFELAVSKIIMDVYSNTAVKSVCEMVAEESKKENFEVSDPVYLYVDGKKLVEFPLKELSERLLSNKISVFFENDSFKPLYTRFFYLKWVTKKKK